MMQLVATAKLDARAMLQLYMYQLSSATIAASQLKPQPDLQLTGCVLRFITKLQHQSDDKAIAADRHSTTELCTNAVNSIKDATVTRTARAALCYQLVVCNNTQQCLAVQTSCRNRCALSKLEVYYTETSGAIAVRSQPVETALVRQYWTQLPAFSATLNNSYTVCINVITSKHSWMQVCTL
eukprot:10063-Heterococcus_DN1.PRE.1